MERWTMYHFSISQPAAKLPTLLRKVAKAIDDLGPVIVYDITYRLNVEEPDGTQRASLTVYYNDK